MDIKNLKDIPGMKMREEKKNGNHLYIFSPEDKSAYRNITVVINEENSGSVSYMEGDENPYSGGSEVTFTAANADVVKKLVKTLAIKYLDMYDLSNNELELYAQFVESDFIVMYDVQNQKNVWGKISDTQENVSLIFGKDGLPSFDTEEVCAKVLNNRIKSTVVIESIEASNAIHFINESDLSNVFQHNMNIIVPVMNTLH